MSRIPDIVIERVHLGEATSAQRARVLADPDARKRLEALEAENLAFLREHPATDEVVADLGRRAHLARTRDAVSRNRRRLWTASAVLVPLAAAALLVAQVGDPAAPGAPDQPMHSPSGENPKGAARAEPELYVYRQTRGEVITIPKNTVLRPRDLVQLGYRRGPARHGAMVSIDGRGEVTLHFPDDGDTTLRSGRQVLPHAYQLDDAPDFERFLFVTADEPIDVPTVVSAAEVAAASGAPRTAPLSLPSDLDQQDFTILKDVP